MTTQFLVNLRGRLMSSHFRNLRDMQKRNISSEEIIRKRNQIFSAEQNRQREKVGRIEKIEVRFMGFPNDSTLVMNKNLSTPYNCAQHLSESHCKNSVVALVDNKALWDMHRPLKDSCTLQLLNFKMSDPHAVNKAFWRSCSFVLGAVMQKTFKEDAGLYLHSFPIPNVRSGSFVHDIALNEKNWKPSEQDLRTLGIEIIKLASENVKIERLEISHNLALEMFKENPFKREQLPNISNQNDGIVTVYRVGDHIDISKGPMIGSTNFIGKTNITSAHKISNTDDQCNVYRVQGVALPNGFSMSYFAFNILVDRSKKLNQARMPFEVIDDQNSSQQFDRKILQQNAN